MNFENNEKYILAFSIMLAVLINPAQAFSVNTLTIDVQPNGDALITVQYGLSAIENTAVYLSMVNPGKELKSALEGMYHHEVTIVDVSGASTQFRVSNFSSIAEVNNKTVMKTPEVSFQSAQKLLDKFWFASMVQMDYTPDTTTITYPDGYNIVYYDQIQIPPTSHNLSSGNQRDQ